MVNKNNFYLEKLYKRILIFIAKEGYVCDQSCSGCWSTGPKSCQLCKTYKLDDFCVDQCENNFLNGKFIYLVSFQNKEIISGKLYSSQ